MKKRFSILSACLLALCGVGLGVVLCYIWAQPWLPGGVKYAAAQTTDSSFAKLDEIQAYLDYYFIGDLDEQKLLDNASAGLIAGTGDRWSYYISADDMAAYQEQM